MFVSGKLNSHQVQGGEESALQHKPPTQSTKPVASASGRFILCSLIFADTAHLVLMPHAGEHGSLQVHEDRVDPSSDYHLPQTSQELTSHSSKYRGKHNGLK